jgi:hypothetical protein
MALDTERLATGLTTGTAADKCGSLLLQEVLLKRLEELFSFGQAQTEMLNALAGFLPDDDISVDCFLTIVITDDELHFDFHGDTPPAAWWGKDVLF